MADRIVRAEQDDRPKRMIEDPEGYFAEARQRASAQVKKHGLRILAKKKRPEAGNS